MKFLRNSFAFSIAIFLLAGCASLVPPISSKNDPLNQTNTDDTGVWVNTDCVGEIEPTPDGLKEVIYEPLLKMAIGADQEGKLCDGKVFDIANPVRVYRVWSSAKPYTAFGSWWSFGVPTGTKESYGKENNICPEWSALDIVHSCLLKVGGRIVVGTGQSAKCENGVLHKTPINQIFVPNDTRNNVLLVDNCSDAEPWPKTTLGE